METEIYKPIKKFGKFSSSVNPQELSLTITSTAKLLIGILVAFGVFEATKADTVIEQVPVIVSAGYATWQGAEAIWGAIRKILVKFTK